MGNRLIFQPGHRIGYLEVLDSAPSSTRPEPENRNHNLWRVWCHYCQSESLVRATSLNPKTQKPNLTCGCRIGAKKGARIRITSRGSFRSVLDAKNKRISGEVAPFFDPNDPQQLIVADPTHRNYNSFLKVYGTEFLIGTYDDDSSSFDIREDYIHLLKSRILDGSVELQKGLNALESLIYKRKNRS